MSLFKYISSYLNSKESLLPNTTTTIEAEYIENIDKKHEYDTIQLTIKTGECILIFNIDVLNKQKEKAITYLKNLLQKIHDASNNSLNDSNVNCEGDNTCFFRQRFIVSFENKNDIVLSATSENRCGCDFRVKISSKSFFEQMYSMINKMEEIKINYCA